MANTIAQNPLVTKLLTPADFKADHQANVRSDAKSFPMPSPQSSDAVFTPSNKASQLASTARMAQLEQSYQTSQTMNLQLTTKEGDKVTVDFRQLYAQYQSQTQMQHTQKDSAAPSSVRYFESKETLEATAFEDRFGFSVEGELNEAELNAVFEVFAQVDALANTFYDGDIEKAFEQAQALNVDFGQLQSVQLDLTQSQSMATRYQQAAVAQYSDVQQAQDGQSLNSPDDKAEEYGVNMASLPPYLQRWQAAIEQFNSVFVEAQSTVEGLMAQTLNQRFGLEEDATGWLERVQGFHAQLLEWAQTNTAHNSANVDSGVQSNEETEQPVAEKPEVV